LSNALRIVPLGGLGEIGRNMMALECGNDIIVIDCGLMFPEQEMLGIDLVIPDISWLVERSSRVRAICITHGHEDHVGALSFVLPRLDVPVYGTALSLALAKNKLKEHKLLSTARLNTVHPGSNVDFGCFNVEWIHTTHSIPDSCALAIRTPQGVVIHTGDFKLDPTPIHGEPPDMARFSQLAGEGVLLLLSDSTNVETEGSTPSERSVGAGLTPIFEAAPGRLIVAAFASNLGRVQQVVDAAAEFDRSCFLAGRSMLNNVRAAAELGFLRQGETGFLNPKQLQARDDKDVVVLCTGAQGEPFSALTRIANGEHPIVDIHEGDTVIISANPIPGNEEAVHRTINQLYKRGARVFSGARHHVHASGHASRDELALMLATVRPQYFVPVHGEYRHLAIHADLAKTVGIPAERVLPVDSGSILEIDAGGIRKLKAKASAEYVYVDGLTMGDSGEEVLRDRRDMAHDGVVVISMALDRRSGHLLGPPKLMARGMSEDTETTRLLNDLQNRIRTRFAEAAGEGVEAQVHADVARYISKRSNRRPLILPVVVRI
jgi:ribonuclease J